MNMNELITKYITKESTPEENFALLNWVVSSDDNKKEFASQCQYWYSSSRANQENNIDTEKAFNLFLQQTKKTIQTTHTAKKISLWQKMSAVAAVAILTLGAFFLFNQQSDVEMLAVANNQNTISDITLPDGSHVFLHKGASIEYPDHFESNNRTIQAHGHFYCEVEPNKDAPFTVQSKNLSIQVLGTAFDVSTAKNSSEVIVSHGKVRVSSNNESVILEIGERADCSNAGIIASKNTDVNFLSWQTGILTFDNTKLDQVFSDIERHYGCTFIITDNSILEKPLNGTYQDTNVSLDGIISIIAETFALEFVKNGNAYTVSK